MQYLREKKVSGRLCERQTKMHKPHLLQDWAFAYEIHSSHIEISALNFFTALSKMKFIFRVQEKLYFPILSWMLSRVFRFCEIRKLIQILK